MSIDISYIFSHLTNLGDFIRILVSPISLPFPSFPLWGCILLFPVFLSFFFSPTFCVTFSLFFSASSLSSPGPDSVQPGYN